MPARSRTSHLRWRWRSPTATNRAAAFVLALLGAVTNFAVAIQLLSFWRVLRWEGNSEWEGSADGWRVDSIKLVWALLTAYFATAAFACIVGIVGVIKRQPSYVRLYRDYSVADLCACGILTTFAALTSFRPGTRAVVCEELSRQPELLRDLAEAGLNLENCEMWFEHAVIGVVGVTAILLVVRLQFILTVSNYYKQLVRQRLYDSIELCGPGADGDSDSPHRIFLLPAPNLTPSSSKSKIKSSSAEASSADSSVTASSSGSKAGKGKVLVYAPVSIDALSEEEARELATTEGWVARPRGHSLSRSSAHSHACMHSHSSSHTRRHSHSHSHSHGHSRSLSSSRRGHGKISLPIVPGEGLLPSYSDADEGDVKA